MKKKILHIIVLAIIILIASIEHVNAAPLNVQGVIVDDPLQTNVATDDLDNEVAKWEEEGTGQTTDNEGNESSNQLNVIQWVLDVIMTIVGWLVAIIPMILNFLLSVMVTGGSDSFSIQDLLLGKYNLFHINLFNADSLTGSNAQVIKDISDSVAIWYVSVRNIAVIGASIILLYVGIRMAISSVAEDKAKYKIMLKNWAVGLVLMFVLQYITVALLNVSDIFVNFIKNAVADNDVIGMEEEIINNSFVNIYEQDGFNKVIYVVIYFMMVYYQFKFFVIYIMRVLKVAFLIIISPLICMTYPIDTIGDNKAQAFNNWIKQMLIEVFLQPIHLCIYIVFIYSAGAIATEAPIVAIMFFAALSNGEKIVRRAFKVEGKGLKDVKLPKVI